MTKRVFISYRRDDTASAAGRVYDRLSRVLGKSNVFFDVSTIAGGADFSKEIVMQIDASDVALIFIGDKWRGQVQPPQRERIWDPNDHVRTEVRTALNRSILVLPVLVAGCRMPEPEQIPEDLRALLTRNALLLRHERFDDDAENIVAVVLGKPAEKKAWENRSTPWSKIAYTMGGVIAASVLMLGGALLHFSIWGHPLSASIGGPLTELLIIAGLIFGAALGLGYERRKRRRQ